MSSHPYAVLALLLALSTPVLSLPVQAAAGPGGEVVPLNRSFDAFIGERQLGTHRYEFTGDGEALTLRSEAQFEFKLGFLTLFSYDHVAEERWSNGCLTRFQSSTEVNDKRLKVNGQWEDGVLALETLDGAEERPEACAWTFPYWNRAITQRSELINIQDGKRAEVTFSPPRPAQLEVGGVLRRVEAQDLKGGEDRKIDITLYYDGPLWLGLDSKLENGRTLHYRPSESDPAFTLGSGQASAQ